MSDDQPKEQQRNAGVPRQRFWPWKMWIRDSETIPAYTQHPDYEASKNFQKNFDIDVSQDIGWVEDLAKKRYELIDQKIKAMDEKADSVVKHLGGGTAIVAAAGLAASSAAGGWLPWMLIPSACCASIAIWHAVLSRRPVDQGFVADAELAMRLVGATKEHARKYFIRLWEVACKAAIMGLDIKSAAVDSAMRWYYRAVIGLLIPLIATPLFSGKPVPAQPTPCRCQALEQP